jgi:phosphate starvation-inducible protein PhoH
MLLYLGQAGSCQGKNGNQLLLASEYKVNDLIIAEGPAGTGKTYTVNSVGSQSLRERRLRR